MSRTNDAVALSVKQFGKTYETGSETVTAVSDVSFEVDHGEVVALLGPNGAGKTTLIKGALGLLLPSNGRVRVDGIDVTTNPKAAFERVSAVLEGARNVYWRLTVRENLRFFAGLQGLDLDTVSQRHQSLLAAFDLLDKADEPVKNLSRGMKQKTGIACALARDTPITFLDEPTLGLDVETTRRLQDELVDLTAEDRTILLSSHDMDVVQRLADRVIIVNEGRIVVDDAVENLIDVFRTTQYEFTVSGSETDGLQERLAASFSLENWNAAPGTATFEVTLADDTGFYELVSKLQSTGVVIESVHTIEPDLEDIFLTVVDRDSEKTPVSQPILPEEAIGGGAE